MKIADEGKIPSKCWLHDPNIKLNLENYVRYYL